MVDDRVLLDAGAPLLPHMHKLGIDPCAIEAIFLTHFHGDHTLGLPPFVLYRIFNHATTLTILGPDGIEDRLEALWKVSWGGDWDRVMRAQFKVRYRTARPSGSAAGLRYQSIKLDHGSSGSWGYRLHVDGRILAYSGDTEDTAPLERLVKGADVAIIEATAPGEVFSHMSWEAAGALKKRHPDTRFLFNHVYTGTMRGAVRDLQVIEA